MTHQPTIRVDLLHAPKKRMLFGGIMCEFFDYSCVVGVILVWRVGWKIKEEQLEWYNNNENINHLISPWKRVELNKQNPFAATMITLWSNNWSFIPSPFELEKG